jgi:serine/threonine-protein kinase ATR
MVGWPSPENQKVVANDNIDVLLNRFDALETDISFPKVIPFAAEASWVMSKWNKLGSYVSQAANRTSDFAIGIGRCLHALQNNDQVNFDGTLEELYRTTAAGLTPTSIASFQACHDVSLKLHVLTELRDISTTTSDNRAEVVNALDQRLDVLGSYVSDKHYLLGCRRAVMELTPGFSRYEIAASWLTTARLARKSASTNQAFTAILRASALGDKSATIEQARLMWMDGNHRKAIQTLEGAIESGSFNAHSFVSETGSVTLTTDKQQQQDVVTAKAYLLLGKWLDTAGQTQSEVIIKTYRKVTEHHRKWEKGWYYLGKHYNKILDSEKAKPVGKESQIYLTGESAKLVIDNYLRSLICGSKYIFQTLPKVLTLWLELVAGIEQPQDARRGNEKFNSHNAAQRKRVVEDTNAQVKKYVDKMQPVVLYTILPQVVARICHPNQAVYSILVSMVAKVVRAFPQQALWPLLAVVKSQSKDRATRGLSIVSKIVEVQKKSGKDTAAADLRNMITQGQKLSDEVLRVSEFPIEGKMPRVSLARDLGFNHKIAPSRLVVPIESCLMPSIPPTYDVAQMRAFRPFSKDAITISAFLDEALVLASLQKPRKLSIRGSDGKVYGVLAKPKDDMRKDQRLMEFNTMINRFLKHDDEASKRRLYIRTYAVVPLNEECGLIEWVDNLKTFRDIILKLYKERNISPNYVDIRNLLDEACSSLPDKLHIFSDNILQNFPPVFHDWFVETFPDPSTWFTARLRYTRSCAVMSIVGHVLGLGDRHGENILFEEDNGGTLHVDFNCLFDKGLTFEKPEYVPFRLTHNILDAFGAYGYNGPFRRCCEITLTLLRGNEDTLMTILETFLHDPTTDFINAGKRKKADVAGVPDTPMGVLDGVRGKVRGMLAGESVPLSVGGYVEEMIKRATDHANLCRMYIGWCAFF